MNVWISQIENMWKEMFLNLIYQKVDVEFVQIQNLISQLDHQSKHAETSKFVGRVI